MNDLWFIAAAIEESNARRHEDSKIHALEIEIAKAKDLGLDTTELEKLLYKEQDEQRAREEAAHKIWQSVIVTIIIFAVIFFGIAGIAYGCGAY